MAYVKPDDVTSPKASWKLNCVIYDKGEGNIAIAYGEWHRAKVIAMRWNGTNDLHKALGNPQSSSNATWFILPLDIGVNVVKDLLIKQVTGDTSVRQDGLAKTIKWLTDVKKITQPGYEAKAF